MPLNVDAGADFVVAVKEKIEVEGEVGHFHIGMIVDGQHEPLVDAREAFRQQVPAKNEGHRSRARSRASAHLLFNHVMQCFE